MLFFCIVPSFCLSLFMFGFVSLCLYFDLLCIFSLSSLVLVLSFVSDAQDKTRRSSLASFKLDAPLTRRSPPLCLWLCLCRCRCRCLCLCLCLCLCRCLFLCLFIFLVFRVVVSYLKLSWHNLVMCCLACCPCSCLVLSSFLSSCLVLSPLVLSRLYVSRTVLTSSCLVVSWDSFVFCCLEIVLPCVSWDCRFCFAKGWVCKWQLHWTQAQRKRMTSERFYCHKWLPSPYLSLIKFYRLK